MPEKSDKAILVTKPCGCFAMAMAANARLNTEDRNRWEKELMECVLLGYTVRTVEDQKVKDCPWECEKCDEAFGQQKLNL